MENFLQIFYEFMATFLILIGIYFVIMDFKKNTFLGVGIIVALSVIIEAHVNPAVTGMFMLTNNAPISSIYTRIVPQILAMIAAAFTISQLNN